MSPARTLPTFSLKEVEAHDSEESCYVTLGERVYDVTDFLDSHPGGGELILEYAGRDVADILKDQISHEHSEAAYEVLDDSLVGFVVSPKILSTAVESDRPDTIVPLPPSQNGLRKLKEDGAVSQPPVFANTGMSSAADLSRETNVSADYKQHKFLDLSKPLLMQLWRGNFSKKFYLEQIHRPRHYKGGESAPLFGNFLEPLSKTAWYVIPTLWLPPVAYGTYLASAGYSSPLAQAPAWLLGVFLWTFFEYILHRFLFHIDGYVLLAAQLLGTMLT